jgi:hypothetical protein
LGQLRRHFHVAALRFEPQFIAASMSDQPPTQWKFNPVWLAVGAGVGVALGTATKNIAIGLSCGIAIGVALGFILPKKK